MGTEVFVTQAPGVTNTSVPIVTPPPSHSHLLQ